MRTSIPFRCALFLLNREPALQARASPFGSSPRRGISARCGGVPRDPHPQPDGKAPSGGLGSGGGISARACFSLLNFVLVMDENIVNVHHGLLDGLSSGEINIIGKIIVCVIQMHNEVTSVLQEHIFLDTVQPFKILNSSQMTSPHSLHFGADSDSIR